MSQVDSNILLSHSDAFPIMDGMDDDDLNPNTLQDSSTNGADSVHSGLLYEKMVANRFNMGLLKNRELDVQEQYLLKILSHISQTDTQNICFIHAHQISGNQKSDVQIDFLSDNAQTNQITGLTQHSLAVSVKNTPDQTQFGFYKPEDFFEPFMQSYPLAVQGFYKFLGYNGWGEQFKKDYKVSFKIEKRERYYLDELTLAERQEMNNLLTDDAFLLHLMHIGLKGKGENQADYLLSPQSQKNDLDNLKILKSDSIIEILKNKYVGSAISYQALNTPINIWDEPQRVICTINKNGNGYKPPENQGSISLLDNLFYLQRKGSILNPTHIQIKASVSAFEQLLIKHGYIINHSESNSSVINTIDDEQKDKTNRRKKP